MIWLISLTKGSMFSLTCYSLEACQMEPFCYVCVLSLSNTFDTLIVNKTVCCDPLMLLGRVKRCEQVFNGEKVPKAAAYYKGKLNKKKVFYFAIMQCYREHVSVSDTRCDSGTNVAGYVKEINILTSSSCSHRAMRRIRVNVWRTKLTSMDVIFKEGMVYLQGVMLVKVKS